MRTNNVPIIRELRLLDRERLFLTLAIGIISHTLTGTRLQMLNKNHPPGFKGCPKWQLPTS